MKDNTGRIITGALRRNGLHDKDACKKKKIAIATFYRCMENSNRLSLDNFRRLSEYLTDAEILEIVRE